MTPMPLNSPDVLRGRELAVSGLGGIRWRVLGTIPGARIETSQLRLLSIPAGTVSEVGWSELRARLLAGIVVIQ